VVTVWQEVPRLDGRLAGSAAARRPSDRKCRGIRQG
jgi:hypothetical protein